MIKVTAKQNNILVGSSLVEEKDIPEILEMFKRELGECVIEIIDEELEDCLKKRKEEYPSPFDFMNAFFDGNEESIKQLQEKRLAIKAKYPKPTKE